MAPARAGKITFKIQPQSDPRSPGVSIVAFVGVTPLQGVKIIWLSNPGFHPGLSPYALFGLGKGRLLGERSPGMRSVGNQSVTEALKGRKVTARGGNPGLYGPKHSTP